MRKWSVNSRKIFLSYQLLLTQSLSLDVDMVLLTPDEINHFISTLKTRYSAPAAAGKKRSVRVRSA
jgi:hypothetical protein